jgi:GrpB-like predicted nucleotidyltransferase (UPF0157 family)
MTVRMMHYDPRWPQEFEQTRSGILQCCRGDVIEVCHIGSTAVSGLVAQPIIDLVAAPRVAAMAANSGACGCRCALVRRCTATAPRGATF